MIAPIQKKIVPLGKIVATPGALEALTASKQSAMEFLSRHRQGDWGDVCGEDWEANDDDLEIGNRVLSTYHTNAGIKLWIITEWDRSSTTILLPDEY